MAMAVAVAAAMAVLVAVPAAMAVAVTAAAAAVVAAARAAVTTTPAAVSWSRPRVAPVDPVGGRLRAPVRPAGPRRTHWRAPVAERGPLVGPEVQAASDEVSRNRAPVVGTGGHLDGPLADAASRATFVEEGRPGRSHRLTKDRLGGGAGPPSAATQPLVQTRGHPLSGGPTSKREVIRCLRMYRRLPPPSVPREAHVEPLPQAA